MLAFLPALSLAAYWGGGEILLVMCALSTPLIYALTGGFGRLSPTSVTDMDRPASAVDVARDFLEIAQHTGQTTACFQIEINGLTAIGKTFGRSRADEAQQVLKTRIAATLRQTDHVFQTGDTRFTVLIAPGFRLKLDSLLDLAKRLRDAAEDPISVAGTGQYVAICIGIASSLNFGRNVTADTWLDSASQALEDALESGTATTRVWSDKVSRRQRTQRDLHQDVAKALDTGQVQAYFQPQVSVRSGDVTGMEAFARWDHPVRGVLPAAEFLQAFAESGQMARLGQTILAQTLAALQGWDQAGLSVPTVSINLSATDLRNPDLPGQIATTLDRHNMLPHRLIVDVPETILSASLDDVFHRTLKAISDAGCGIDLDAFGTGPSRIALLPNLYVQRLKIGRGLIQGADLSDDKQRILGALIALADGLDLPSLGVGVETVGEHGVLRELGCGFAQGYLFAAPAPHSEITDWLANRQGQADPKGGPHLRRVK